MADTIVNLTSGNFQYKQIAGQLPASASGTGALRTSMVEPEGYELSRAGRRFHLGINATPTGIAPVQAIATTAAQWTIWNSSTTKSLVFESLGVYLASGVAGAGIVVNVCHFTTPAQTGANATGLSAQSASASTTASVAIIKSAVTITGPALPYWYPIATNVNAATAVLSTHVVNFDVRGRVIVPPTSGLGIYVASPAGTTPLYVPSASWVELESDLV